MKLHSITCARYVFEKAKFTNGKKRKENTVFKNQPISQYICTCNHKDTIFEDKSLGIEKEN